MAGRVKKMEISGTAIASLFWCSFHLLVFWVVHGSAVKPSQVAEELRWLAQREAGCVCVCFCS